jgi:hypothetical protein
MTTTSTKMSTTSSSAEKRPRSSDMDSNDAKATKKAKSPKGTLKTNGTPATAGSNASLESISIRRSGSKATAVAMNGNGAPKNVAVKSNGNSSRDAKPGKQVHLANGDDNSGTVESRPPMKQARGVDAGKATVSTTENGGSKAKASSSAETPDKALSSADTPASTTTKAGFEPSSKSSWAWSFSMLFLVAVLLLLTNVVTLGMLLETKMEYELQTAELQEQVKELPQLLQTNVEYELRTAELQEQLKEIPEALQALASWQDFGRNMEHSRNDCADALLDLVRESGRECIDVEAGCPGWAEAGECPQNPGFMLPSCRLSCQAC